MFRIENLKKLSVQIGITGGLITFVLINTVPIILNRKIKQMEEYKEAMKMVKSHPEAVKYLGEPIQDGNINVTKKEMYGSDDEKMWFSVPVKGPKSLGNVYCENRIKKEGHEIKTELAKVEMTLKSVPGYKLMIKRSE